MNRKEAVWCGQQNQEDKSTFASRLRGTKYPLSHPSQGVLNSDGIWRVKSIPNGKGEASPDTAGWGTGQSRNMEKGTFLLRFLQVPPYSPLLQLQNHLSPQRAASESGQTSSESIFIPGASV